MSIAAAKDTRIAARGPRYLRRLVRRVLWKRENEYLRYRVWRLEQEMERLRDDRNAARDAYIDNLEELANRDSLVRHLRRRLSEVGRAERTRKVRLP